MVDVAVKIYVDWDADGDFDELYEDITDTVKTAGWTIGCVKPYQIIAQETRLDLGLNNQDMRFTPENGSSPYFGELLPQRKVKIEVTYESVVYPLYLGWIEKIRPSTGDNRTATISCVGAKQYLEQQTVRLVLQENQRSDQIIQAILEDMQLPPALSGDQWILGIAGQSELGVSTYLADITPAIDLDVGDSTFVYAGDNWNSEVSTASAAATSFKGMDAIEDVVKAEQGRFFFSRDGKATFWNRSRLQLATAVDVTWDALDSAADYRFGEDILNDVTVMVYPRSVEVDTVLWELDEEIELRRNKEKTIRAKYSERNSGVSVAGQDVTVSTDTTPASVSVAVEFLAESATITLKNTGKKATVAAGDIILKGKKLTTLEKFEVQQIDGTSRVTHGWREERITSKLIDTENYARSLAEYRISQRKDPRGVVTNVSFGSRRADDYSALLATGIGERVDLTIKRRAGDTSHTMHSGEHFVIGEKFEWHYQRGFIGQKFLEPADMQQYWVLGVAGYSELGTTTYLGF